jgi:hypothetical protein
MRQHILKKPAFDLGAWEGEIQRRLQRGKTRLLNSVLHIGLGLHFSRNLTKFLR